MKKITIGFTGTRKGFSDKQREFVIDELNHVDDFQIFGEVTVVHGGCIGSDEDFHRLVKEHYPQFKVHVRPGYSSNNPNDLSNRFDYSDADKIYPPKSHFSRNRDIVESSSMLWGTPPTEVNLNKGGTWYTINYGLKVDNCVLYCTPDGKRFFKD